MSGQTAEAIVYAFPGARPAEDPAISRRKPEYVAPPDLERPDEAVVKACLAEARAMVAQARDRKQGQ